MSADELRAAVERNAEALRMDVERLSPRQRGPLWVNVSSRSDRFSASEVIAELSSMGGIAGGKPVEERRVLFIGGPLDGRSVRTRIDADRKEVWKHNARFVYQIETVDIAGETVTLGILDTPETLPPLVKAALDRVAEAVAEAERREQKRAAALAREERYRRQDACEHHWVPIWDAEPHIDTVVAWCPLCGLGQGPILQRFRDFGETRRSNRS
jgi:hypothetical protein